MLLRICAGNELLIIAVWLAVKLVEHVGDLKRSERHVSVFVSMNYDEYRDIGRYEKAQCRVGVLVDLLIQSRALMREREQERWAQNARGGVKLTTHRDFLF